MQGFKLWLSEWKSKSITSFNFQFLSLRDAFPKKCSEGDISAFLISTLPPKPKWVKRKRDIRFGKMHFCWSDSCQLHDFDMPKMTCLWQYSTFTSWKLSFKQKHKSEHSLLKWKMTTWKYNCWSINQIFTLQYNKGGCKLKKILN